MSLLAKFPWPRRRVPAAVAADGTAAIGAPEALAAVPGPRLPTDEASGVSEYASFKVLLDDPAARPGLGFDGYAAALADTILHSRAEFAVGIFGSWGSGKTTLMHAIERVLARHENVVPVWFAAWRYEKDPNLLLPLLDVINDALEARTKGKKGWAHDAAVGVGRAGQAFLAGLKVSANLPVIQADFEPGKMIEAIRKGREQPRPLSFYRAGFKMLQDAIRGLSGNGTRRVVIFVDDLDRCMPPNALDVLESMKLFFDVEGCIFVVGLDQEIAERAVALKYRAFTDADVKTGTTGAALTQQSISGSEYLKKLFQVWFSLPPVQAQQLQEYLDTIETGDLGEAQRRDFTENVCRHFKVLQGQALLNPREIKRLINVYTLQLKVLAPRLATSLNPNVVLGLLSMNYRQDWKALYDHLSADPEYVQSVLRAALDADQWPNSVWLAGSEVKLPPGFVEYLGGLAAPVLRVEDLPAYVSAAESTWSTDPWVLEARTAASHLRGTGDELKKGTLSAAEAARRIRADVDHLNSLISSRRESFGRLGVLRQQLAAYVAGLMDLIGPPVSADAGDTFRVAWQNGGLSLIEDIDATLLEWHRYIALGS